MKIKNIIEISITAALSVVLHYITVFQMPQGGNVSFVMLPILFIALRNGVVSGVICGIIVGLLTFMMGGFFLSPLQVLLDYPMAFGAIGIAGIFSRKFNYYKSNNDRNKIMVYSLIAGSLALSSRLFFHIWAGVTFYASYAPKGTNIWLYSCIYNASYVIPDGILAIIGVYLISRKLIK